MIGLGGGLYCLGVLWRRLSDVGSSSLFRASLFSDGPQEGAEPWQGWWVLSQHIFWPHYTSTCSSWFVLTVCGWKPGTWGHYLLEMLVSPAWEGRRHHSCFASEKRLLGVKWLVQGHRDRTRTPVLIYRAVQPATQPFPAGTFTLGSPALPFNSSCKLKPC